MADWTIHAREALQHGPAALVTILATEGSAPRGAGARMVVTETGLAGTIGGGRLEHLSMAQARAILAHAPGSWRVQDYPLGPMLGQCCGGRVRLLVERLADVPEADGSFDVVLADRVRRTPLAADDAPPAPISARGPMPAAGAHFLETVEAPSLPVLLFGAGHVGRAIAGRAVGLPLDLRWYDCRAETVMPGVSLADVETQVAAAAEAPEGAAVVVMTHDHGLDYRLVAAALGGRARFVGLIGSETKRTRFLSRLAKEGIDGARLVCPIGLPGISGREPEVIAIAALAQLLMLRDAP